MTADDVRPGIFTPTVQPEAPIKFIEDIWPRVFETGVVLSELSYHPGCVRLDEMVLLASIVAHLQPARLFEIGTCFGRTTINLARNAAALEAFYTLNLPPGDASGIDWLDQDRQLYELSKDHIGERWRRPAYAQAITQLYGDSANFDFAPYRDMDLVFIDANKQEQYVASDSEHGWEMLRGGGLLLWHDYAYCDGVTLAVDEFARRKRLEVINIHKTTLAMAMK